MPSWKPSGAGLELVAVELDRDEIHRAAGEPGTPEPRQRVVPRDQRADAGGQAEQFVEGQSDEIGGPACSSAQPPGDNPAASISTS